MAKRYFKDMYGCTGSIRETPKGFWVRVCGPCGTVYFKGLYNTYRGARNALGRQSDCWREV